MYLNEKAWEVEPEDLYEASDALKNFLDVYKVLAGKYGRPEVYKGACGKIRNAQDEHL